MISNWYATPLEELSPEKRAYLTGGGYHVNVPKREVKTEVAQVQNHEKELDGINSNEQSNAGTLLVIQLTYTTANKSSSWICFASENFKSTTNFNSLLDHLDG